MNQRSESALVIVGHGSTENPDSSVPTWAQADEIRRRGIFGEVYCTFWKEEPWLRQVRYMIERREVYVVPNFISEGYFTKEVIPRELRLTERTTELDGTLWHYCDPVGIHPGMTRLLLQRAREVAPGAAPEDSALIIVGHGTSLNARSTEAIKDQVRLLKEQNLPYREILDAYMEEPPFIAEWDKLTNAPHVIVVPFFIADGLHSYQDIPVLLGMRTEPGAAASEDSLFLQNPVELRGRLLYYSRAIGTEPAIANVILDQVTHFDEHHRSTSAR